MVAFVGKMRALDNRDQKTFPSLSNHVKGGITRTGDATTLSNPARRSEIALQQGVSQLLAQRVYQLTCLVGAGPE